MKKYTFIVLLLFFMQINYALGDSLYVENKQDTLIVWNVNVWENCGFTPIMNIEVIDSHIIITEKDTSLEHTTCSMYKDFRIPITGLAEGNYTIEIWRAYSASYYPDTASFITSLDINFIISSINNNKVDIESFKLDNIYPNPFNPTANISYNIPETTQLKISLFDVLGRELEVIHEGIEKKGKYKIIFDGNSYSSGIYYVRMLSNNYSIIKKIVLQK